MMLLSLVLLFSAIFNELGMVLKFCDMSAAIDQ